MLENITCASDVKKLNIKELKVLSEEIRKEILCCIEKNGGHLASNLGIVELTLALHYVFDFPTDKIIFDVGHQCYTHKLLTRKESFYSIRTEGGLAGFPDTEESEYDNFITGHAGTSISAGIGYSFARDKQNESYKVISVVGDGSIINGLNLEALTNGDKPKNFIVVLNDNGMSINKNNSSFYRAISKATTKRSYSKFKNGIKKVFGNSFITRGLIRFRNFLKRLLSRNQFFEQFGFKYVGIVDGNDLNELVSILKRIKNEERPILLHIDTKKGKGFKLAEEEADKYHGISKDMKVSVNDFSDCIGKTLVSLAENNDKIVAVTAGMKDGTGLKLFEEKFPDRFIDVGISEEYAVTLSGAMSLAGLTPVVAIYSTFMQRAYDEILHDVCLQNAGVVFCLDRAGVVGADGKTHQGVFDLSYLSHIPNLTILAPKDVVEAEKMLAYAISLKTPVALRYPNGKSKTFESVSDNFNEWEILKGDLTKNKVILAVGGRMIDLALNSADDDTVVINARSVKPLDEKILLSLSNKRVLTLEENSKIGGFGSLVSLFMQDKKIKADLTILGIEDKFVAHASVGTQLENNGLSIQNLKRLLGE